MDSTRPLLEGYRGLPGTWDELFTAAACEKATP